MKRSSYTSRRLRERRTGLSPYARYGKREHSYEGVPLHLNFTATPKRIRAFNERLGIGTKEQAHD